MQVQKNICYCKDIEGLMTELGCEHNPAPWRLFIDSHKTSLKAVLLHNDNIKPSIPVGYSILRKETYDTIKIQLDILEYPTYNWKICRDLKVVSLLLGLQLGYTKHTCFLRSTTFGRDKKGADNKGATKRAQNKKGTEQKGRREKGAEQKGRRAKRAQNKKVAEQKGRKITMLRHRYIQGRNFFR